MTIEGHGVNLGNLTFDIKGEGEGKGGGVDVLH